MTIPPINPHSPTPPQPEYQGANLESGMADLAYQLEQLLKQAPTADDDQMISQTLLKIEQAFKGII